ncbi:unnamed protein product [Prunus armeniaca]
MLMPKIGSTEDALFEIEIASVGDTGVVPAKDPPMLKSIECLRVKLHNRRPNPSKSGTLEQTIYPRTRTPEQPNPPQTRTPFRLASW